MKDPITIGEKYNPAMKITTQEEADAYFEECVLHTLKHLVDETMGSSAVSPATLRLKAESIERSNLGYYAGYYDDETRERVERLFKCSHPIFGAIAEVGPPTPEQAFKMGMDAAEKHKSQ